MSQVEFDEDMATRSRRCTGSATRCAGAGSSARRSASPLASASSTSAAGPASTAPSWQRRWGRLARWSASTRARRCSSSPPAAAPGTSASSFALQTPSRCLSTTPASTPRCACKCSSTSPTRRWRWPRCTEPFDRAGGCSCGTSTGRRSPCTRWTPPSASVCCAPGTSTSPTPPCRAHSGPGCARRVSRRSAWMRIRSPLRARPPDLRRGNAPVHRRVRGRTQRDHRRAGAGMGRRAAAARPARRVLFASTQLCFMATKPRSESAAALAAVSPPSCRSTLHS